jgi:hypothetical protein
MYGLLPSLSIFVRSIYSLIEIRSGRPRKQRPFLVQPSKVRYRVYLTRFISESRVYGYGFNGGDFDVDVEARLNE